MKNFTFIKRVFSLSFILILALNTQAKDKFKKGYFIQKGDTFQGFIEYKNWKQSPSFIRFKSSPEAEARIFSPVDVQLFTVANKVYHGQVVDIETSSRDEMSLDPSEELNISKEAVFVEQIIFGDKNLFVHIENTYEKHFYIEEEGKLKLLVHKKYFKEDANGDPVVRHNNLFQNQLFEHLNECSKIMDPVVSTRYNLKSMKKLFKVYNDCGVGVSKEKQGLTMSK